MELVQLNQACRLPYSHMSFQLCPQIFYMNEIRALWWPLQNIDFIVIKPLCNQFFPPNVTMVIMAKQFKPQDMSPKTVFLCAFANCNLPFLYCFWSNGFFLAEWPFSPCRYRTCFSVDNDTLLPASASFFTGFCFCSEVYTYIMHQSAFISVTQNPIPSWAIWWLDIPIVFMLACNCLSRWIWHPQASGNGTQGWTRYVEVHNSLPDILADFFWFTHDVTQGSGVFEACLEIHPQVFLWLTQMLSVNLNQKLPMQWHHHLGFPK